ncbi:MAG: hypothetical protein J6M23_02005 [Bacteroidales bacterium]|nr:hypothetical protein [Bacteroidales bacterium]
MAAIKRIPVFLLFLALSACRYIDEDLTACDQDFPLSYELRLETNVTTELETELSLETDVAVATALRTYLKEVFTDRAHDVDLSFYDAEGEQPRLHHERHIMDASQTSYTLHIPVHNYLHLGLANLENNPALALENDATAPGSRLQQQIADTLTPHRKGVFTARERMDVKEGVSQEFKVRLYMANCAASLVLDTLGSGVKDIRVFATGFATAFDVADSVYRYQHTPVFKADKIDVNEPGAQLCFATVNFPSRMPQTKADEKKETYWEFRVYSTLPSGSITETKLSVTRPLGPAQFEILKAIVYGNGSLEPEDATVGVTVSTDWKPGMEHEISL